MDFNIARKYCIYLLVILNVILIFSIAGHNNNVSVDSPYSSRKAVDNFNKVLADRGIKLSAELQSSKNIVGIANVEYEDLSDKKFGKIFSDFPEAILLSNNKKIEIELSRDDVLVTRKKYDLEDVEDRMEFSKEVMNLYFNFSDFKLKELEDTYVIEYNPIIDGYVYESSYVKFVFDEKIKITFISIAQKGDILNRKKAITPLEAVLIALPSLESGDEIREAELIYYFDLDSDDLHKVKNARAFPTYRIISSGDKISYIPAIKE